LFLGEPTAGYVTINDGFKINESCWINLSVGYSMDKNKKLYTNKIEPDLLFLDGDNFEQLEKDKKIIQAIEVLDNIKNK
jgi:carboxyl-terminal processing protease